MKKTDIFSWAVALGVLIALNIFLLQQDISFTGWAVGNESLEITLNSPENNSLLDTATVDVELETNIEANCSLEGAPMQTTGSTTHTEQLTLENGNYNYTANCNNKSISFRFTVNKSEECTINITTALITNVNTTTLEAESNCNCSYNNTDLPTNITLTEGNNEITIECGNETETINITLDTIAPTITKVKPSEYTIRESYVEIETTTNEDSICYYDGSLMTKAGNTHSKTITSLTDNQIYNKNIECNDTANNGNSLAISFKADYIYCGDDICQTGETVNCNDCDIDNDDIKDNEDPLLGLKEDVITKNVKSFSIEVGGSTNLKKDFSGDKKVEFISDKKNIIEFIFDFDDEVLDLRDVRVEKQKSTNTYGYIIIRDLDLEGAEKTVYVDREKESDKLCIEDKDDIEEISEVSSNCSGTGETLIECPGEEDGYECKISSKRYKITGLEHSAVREVSSSVTKISEDSPPDCKDAWKCTEWNPSTCPAEERQIRKCTNSINDKCTGKPSEVKLCEYEAACNDRKKNQGETGVDCGGPCKPCRLSQTVTGKASTEKNVEAPRNLLRKESPWLYWLVITMIIVLLGVAAFYYIEVERKQDKGFNENEVIEAESLLQDNIHKAFSNGFKQEQIKESLIQKGWNKELADKILSNYKINHHHNKLEEYIKKSLEEGKTKQAIEHSLLLKGWPKKLIKEAIEKAL